MPLYLRVVRKSRWYSQNLAWLGPDDIQADALSDLKTQDNRLSLYEVADDRSNLDETIAALAATRDNLTNLDYALLPSAVLSELSLRCERSPGQTPDPTVNARHIDLVELTVKRLTAVVNAIPRRGTIERKSQKAVGQLLRRALETGAFPDDQLKPSLLKGLLPKQ